MATMSNAGFTTFQNVENYEATLARHAQWVRWIRVVTCPCMTEMAVPDPGCTKCNGRGKLHRNPTKMSVVREDVRRGKFGRLYPLYPSYDFASVEAYDNNMNRLTLSSFQPPDGSYIQLAQPYPQEHSPIYINYMFSTVISVTNENSQVIVANVLRTIASRFVEKNKTFEGTIEQVTRVRNITKAENYVVQSTSKEYIYLDAMGTWAIGDILEVDYTYVKPFPFVIFGVSEKLRYEAAYVLKDADAVLVAPFWANVGPDDVFTMMAGEMVGASIIRPGLGAYDEIREIYDLSALEHIVDRNGVTYAPNVDVVIFERNKLKWNVAKPATPYTVQYTYHPTFVGLKNFDSLKHAENKGFVNRLNLIAYEKLDSRMF